MNEHEILSLPHDPSCDRGRPLSCDRCPQKEVHSECPIAKHYNYGPGFPKHGDVMEGDLQAAPPAPSPRATETLRRYYLENRGARHGD